MSEKRITRRQWFRMSFMECCAISMMILPYITIQMAGSFHIYALFFGMILVGVYGLYLWVIAKQFQEGYIRAIVNQTGRFQIVWKLLYSLRYLFRIVLIVSFFAQIVERYLLRGSSVWWIMAAFLAISIYAAGKGMQERARLLEFLFWWMLFPLLLVVILSICNLDLSAFGTAILSDKQPVDILRAGYAVMLALSPLELQLYTQPCIKKEERPVILRFYVWLIIAICFSYLYIIGILGVHWAASDVTAGFNVMEAAAAPGRILGRMDYPIMAFWMIGVFAMVSGFAQQSGNYLQAIKGTVSKHSRIFISILIFVILGVLLIGMQNSEFANLMMNLMFLIDFGVSIALPFFLVLTKKTRKQWLGNTLLILLIITILISGYCISGRENQFDTQFLTSKQQDNPVNATALEQRDYVICLDVERYGEELQYVFEIPKLEQYQNEGLSTMQYSIVAENLQQAIEESAAEGRHLDLGHIESIKCDLPYRDRDNLLLEISQMPQVPKSIPICIDGKEFVLREMIKAAYGREQ